MLKFNALHDLREKEVDKEEEKESAAVGPESWTGNLQ